MEQSAEKEAVHNDWCWSFCVPEPHLPGFRYGDCDCPCHPAENDRPILICACGLPLPSEHDETKARLVRAQHTIFSCRTHPYPGRDAEGNRIGRITGGESDG